VHDPGVDDQGAVDEGGARFGQADGNRAGVALCPGASQETAPFQARHQAAERGLAERNRFQERAWLLTVDLRRRSEQWRARAWR
jgi:hypothetical protein